MAKRVGRGKRIFWLGGIILVAFLAFLLLFKYSPPQILSASVYPEKVMPGQVMIVTAQVKDTLGIKSAVAIFDNEKMPDERNIPLITGTGRNGVYETRWIAHDTLAQKWYNTTIIFTDILGKKSMQEIAWQDPTVSHSAADITAGTFGAGNFIFPNSLNVSGILNATSTLYTTSTGKVGIGTSNPNQALDVVGTINASVGVNVSGIALPQYSDTRFAVGTFTHDISISGTQQITVGFQPKAVIFAGVVDGASQMSIAFDGISADKKGAIMTPNWPGATAGLWGYTDDALFLLFNSGTYTKGTITATDATSFTFTWTKTGSPTGTAAVSYLAIR